MLKTIKIGGVPEHFNLPWHLAIENGAFQKENLDIQWTDFYGGTGAMTKALREGEADIAVVLTEGIIADIIKGNGCKIIGQYVKSPLTWGIHTGTASPFQDANELKGARFAISRFGSGSHIMTFVDANNRGWNPAEQQFVKVGNLDGARSSLTARETDALLWEKFTTKPYVDNGELRRIGETVTPWPCFVMAAKESFVQANLEEVKKLLRVIQRSCSQFMFQANAAEVSVQMVAERYKLKVEDVKVWFGQTRWSTNNLISRAVLRNVVDTLNDVGVIEERVEPEDLCAMDIIQFERAVFNFSDKAEQSNFFNSTVPQLLEKAHPNLKARWGLMSCQHMIEHLTNALFLSLKKFELPLVLEGERQLKAKKGILSNKAFPRSVAIPGQQKEPVPLRKASIEESKAKLLESLQKTLSFFEQEENQAWEAIHPYGGSFNVEEWRTFHYKHFVHHFRQFGLIE